MNLSELDGEIASELVHCIEDEERDWLAVCKQAARRDGESGFCVSRTLWLDWLLEIERIVRTAREDSAKLTPHDHLRWDQLLSALPETVFDAEIDEVSFTIHVRERLRDWWKRHVAQPEGLEYE